MKLYEYDNDGWLVGWHEDVNRPNSTTTDYAPIPPAHARWVDGSWVEDSSKQNALIIAPRLAEAWSAADKLAAQMDANSRTSLLWIYYDPSTSLTCKNMILEVQQWWSDIWNVEYARVKDLIEAGQDEKFNPANVGDCPYTIWQINTAR